MTRNASRRKTAILLVALLTPLSAVPVADAWHVDDAVSAPEEPPMLPADIWTDTDYVFIDRAMHDTEERIQAANNAWNASYQVMRSGVDNAEATLDAATPALPLKLFVDGAGGYGPLAPADARRGGFGDWQVIGAEAWSHDPMAAFSGDQGYTQATEPGGRYASSTRSLLVSPEIDLDTNFLSSNSDTIRGTMRALNRPENTLNTVYDTMPGSPLLSATAEACTLTQYIVGPFASCNAYAALLGDPVYSLRFAMRHNLAEADDATGLDGVTVLVFTSPPGTIRDAEGCERIPRSSPNSAPFSCAVAAPTRGYSHTEIRSMPVYGDTQHFARNAIQGAGAGSPTYAGYSGSTGGWISDSINLAPWEGRSVWVGFLFTSSSFPPGAYFDSESRFDTGAGFYGFHMDDIIVEAPAAPYNLNARVATQPSEIPRSAAYQAAGIPTLPPNTAFTARGQIANLGSLDIDVRGALRVLRQDPITAELSPVGNASGPYEFIMSDPEELGPGRSLKLEATFPGLSTGIDYVVQICGSRQDTGQTPGDATYCDTLQQTGTCSADDHDADVCDELSLHRFNVEPVIDWTIGQIEQADSEVQVGDSTVVTMTLQNDGNLEQVVHATPRIITLGGASASASDQRMLLRANSSNDQLIPQQIYLPPGSSVPLAWDVRAVTPGQFKLMVDITEQGASVPAFHVRDLLPETHRPWRSWTVHDEIVADGLVNEAAWFNNTASTTLRGGTTLRMANNVTGSDDVLHMVFEGVQGAHLEVIFGEQRDGRVTGYAVDDTGIHDIIYDAQAGTWLNTDLPSIGAQAGRTATPDGFTYELTLPIDVGLAGAGTAAAPGDEVPILVRSCEPGGLRCISWPRQAPMEDGAGIHPMDGNLDQELAQWQVLVLGAGPPRVPVFERLFSSGIGVDVEPPPLLYEDFTRCSDAEFFGWIPRVAEQDGMTDKWNCGPYDDEGGRSMLFQGVDPDDVVAGSCDGACSQYAMLPGYRQLITRPFTIPVEMAEPFITLTHQFSTDIIIDDNHRVIYQENLPQMWVEVYNEGTGGFDQAFRLRPDGGYTSEADAGIADHRFERMHRAPDTLADGSESTGWWWPQGEFPLYRNETTNLPHGGAFSGSSPWRTDTIPLYGDHFGARLDLQGRTVQIAFDHPFHVHPEVGDVSLNGRNRVHVDGGDMVTTPPADFLAMDPEDGGGAWRAFTAICSVGTRAYLLVQSPDGCDGVVQWYDIILPPPINVNNYMRQKQHFQSVQYHDEFLNSDNPPSSPPPPPPPSPRLNGRPLEHLPGSPVFDWVDVDRDGLFTQSDSLFVNMDRSATVGPGDIRIRGSAKIGLPYCGTMSCSPTAATADARDLVYVDRNGDGDWDARSYDTFEPNSGGVNELKTFDDSNNNDMLLLPNRVLNGDTTVVDVEKDWGWRLGGLAVTGDPVLRRDIAVQSVALDVAWDADSIGIGPGTTVPVEIEVANRGALGGTTSIELLGYDARSGAVVCSDRLANLHMVEGGSRIIRLECVVPADQIHSRLALRAEAALIGTAKDSMPANNHQRMPRLYDIVPYPEGAIETTVTPAAGAEGVKRQITVAVENKGNVPLVDAELEVRVQRLTDDGAVPLMDPLWIGMHEAIQPGHKVVVSSRNSNLTSTGLDFVPDVPGLYLVKSRLIIPGEKDPSNNLDRVEVKAQQVLYRDGLDGDAPIMIPGIVEGAIAFEGADIWASAPNSHDGSGRLAVGDLVRGEIPVDSDAAVRLPTIDLGAVKDATLSFRHRYDLEENFDAARVEVSLDGGKTWSPIQPKPKPGLPDGYSPGPLIGATAILGDRYECPACAFTGDSGDVPGNVDGWITSEFDLANQRQFLVEKAVADFRLDGFVADPAVAPIFRAQNQGAPDDVQWTYIDPARRDAGAPYWSIDDDGWYENHQYWWIENRTFSEPTPTAGRLMWWSGSVGVPDADGSTPKLGTTLSISFNASSWPQLDQAEEIVLSFWDWRAGWRTSGRGGSGGAFLVGQPAGAYLRVAEELPSGWTRREVVLPPGVAEADVSLTYYSGQSPSAPTYVSGSGGGNAPFVHEHATYRNNRGWFVDGVQVLAYSAAAPRSGLRTTWVVEDLSVLDSASEASKKGWSSTVVEGHDPTLAWSLVSRGAAATDSGWKVEPVNVPGKGPTAAWRFASDDYPEGYLPNADSVVVTPMVDLRNYAAEDLEFRFDHKFGFQGTADHYHRYKSWQNGPAINPDTGKWDPDIVQQVVGEAGDGGTVVYQVYDADTGTYGPWTTLVGAEPIGDHTSSSSINSAFATNLEAAGYVTAARRLGSSLEQVDFTYADGGGSQFPSSPWRVSPYAPAFSGDSERLLPPDQDGWGEAAWDISHLIGEQVRFGFHVWTNPGSFPCDTRWYRQGSGAHASHAAPDDHLPVQCPETFDTNVYSAPYFNSALGHWETHAKKPAPSGGWSIANVQVVGKNFEGRPADLRLRVATDSTFNKGQWSVDDLTVVGTRYSENIVFTADAKNILAEPGRQTMIEAAVENLGDTSREGLAVHVAAFYANSEAEIPVQILGLPYATIPPSMTPAGIVGAIGPFDLAAGGSGDHRIPFRLAIDAPEGTWDVNIVLRVLQRPCDECPFQFARNEEGGSARDIWSMRIEEKLDLAFIQPREDTSQLLVPDRAILQAGEEVTMTAAIKNQGILEPEATVQWSLSKIDRKGDPVTQTGLKAKQSTLVHQMSEPLGQIKRGDMVPLQADVPLPSEGLYEITAEILVDGTSHSAETLEFFVGAPRPYYRSDFAEPGHVADAWLEQSPEVGSSEGGTPESIRFRQVADKYVWGVSTEEYVSGLDYCSFGGCDHNVRNAQGPPQYGLNGQALSVPLVDLSHVPGNDAVLTLHHSHLFEEFDGARLEVMPIRLPIPTHGNPQPAFVCRADNTKVPLWFAPAHFDEARFQARIMSLNGYTNPGGMQPPPDDHSPERRNPLNEKMTWNLRTTETTEKRFSDMPAFGGPADDEVAVRYDLSAAPVAFCPPGTTPDWEFIGSDSVQPTTLVNYTLQLRLRTGTLPGVAWQCEARDPSSGNQPDSMGRTQGPKSWCPHNGESGDGRGRPGGMGWHISSISANSVVIDVAPEHRVLPALDGYPKTYGFSITNNGTVAEEFAIRFVPEKSSPGLDQDWFMFEHQSVELGAKQSKTAFFTVQVPQDPSPPRGLYEALFEVYAVHDPSLREPVRIDLDLADQPLPDLTVQLAADAPGLIPKLQQDTTATLSMTVSNIGLKDSEPVSVRTDVLKEGSTVPVTQMLVGRLCPASQCGDDDGGSRRTLTYEWLVPHEVGTYRLRSQVDPEGRLVEASKSQNNATLMVQVVPLQRPDLAISGLAFEGVNDDGYGTEGDLVRIVADVTNVGVAPATEVDVLILSGAAEVAAMTLDSLAPGETKQVSATRLAARGESLIRAVAFPDPSETDATNNEMSRFLRVRGIDLNVTREGHAPQIVAEGAAATMRIVVGNDGNVVERVVLSVTPEFSDWGLSASPNPVTVAPGSAGWSLITLQPPPGAIAGTHEVLLHASPQSRPDWKSTIPVAITIAPEARSATLVVDETASDASQIVVDVRSNSNFAETVSLEIGEFPHWHTGVTSVELPAGGSARGVLHLDIPAHTPTGPTNVTIMAVNAAGSTIASQSAPIEVPDMLAGKVTWSPGHWLGGPERLGRTYVYVATVTNEGNVPFVTYAKLRGLPVESQHLQPNQTRSVDPGAQADLPIHLHTLEAHLGDVEGTAHVFAQDGADHQMLTSMRLPSLTMPDLVLTKVQVAPAVRLFVDEPAKLTALVSNIGIVASPETKMYAFVNDQLVATRDVAALAPGDQMSVNVTMAFARPGQQLVYLQSNAAGQAQELYTDNNGENIVVQVEQRRTQAISSKVEQIPAIPVAPLILAAAALTLLRRRGGRS